MFFRSKKGKDGDEKNGTSPNEVLPPPQARPPFAVTPQAPAAAKPATPAPAAQTAASQSAAAKKPAVAAAAATPGPAKAAPAVAGKKDVVKVMGQVAALMMRAPGYSQLKLADLMWSVVPPLHHGQFAVAEARTKDTGENVPVGVVLWALVSDEVDRRLSADSTGLAKLEQKDWKSGPNPWFLCVIGADKVTDALMQQSLEKAIKARSAKARVISADGRVTIRAVTAAAK